MLAMSKRLNFKRFCVDLVCTVLPSENTDYCYCVLGLICLFLMLILFYETTNRKKFNIFFHFSRELQKKNHIRRLLHSTNFFVLHSKIIFVHLHRIESHAITNQNLFLGSRAAASQFLVSLRKKAPANRKDPRQPPIRPNTNQRRHHCY